jgi:hypothetical protein
MNTNFITSKVFIGIVIALFGCAALAASFGLGELVGYQKARFSYVWGDQYAQNFGGPRHGLFGAPGEPMYIDAHGMSGTVLKIDGTTIVTRGIDNREKLVVTDPQTQIQGAPQIQINDHIVVIGMPNEQGQIVAKFIRILPQ